MLQYLFSFLFSSILLLLIVPLGDMACSLSPEDQRVIERAQESLQRHQGLGASREAIHINLDAAYFKPNLKQGNHQVKVIVNYNLTNNSLLDTNANAVLKVFAANGTLLKTSSFPSGFILDNTGTKQLLTNIPYASINNITAVIDLTNQNKNISLSNMLRVPMNLGNTS